MRGIKSEDNAIDKSIPAAPPAKENAKPLAKIPRSRKLTTAAGAIASVLAVIGMIGLARASVTDHAAAFAVAAAILGAGIGAIRGNTFSIAFLFVSNSLLLLAITRDLKTTQLFFSVPCATIEALLIAAFLPDITSGNYRHSAKIGMALGVVLLMISPPQSLFPAGKYISLDIERGLVTPFIFFGPTALMIFLLKKKLPGRFILMSSILIQLGMTFVGESFGQRYGDLGNPAPGQHGAGMAITCVLSGVFAGLIVAPIGWFIREATSE